MSKVYIDDLVKRLSKENTVECIRPEKNAQALKECIERDYIHIMFKNTGTELGVELYHPDCMLEADFENSSGKIHIAGALILNFVKVKCVADIDIATCEGTGFLVPISDEEYGKIKGKD